MKRQAKKARAIRQTQFDRELIAVDLLVSEFSTLLEQLVESPAYRDDIATRLWAIRLRELPDAVQSLAWAMKQAQMKALPLEGGQ